MVHVFIYALRNNHGRGTVFHRYGRCGVRNRTSRRWLALEREVCEGAGWTPCRKCKP